MRCGSMLLRFLLAMTDFDLRLTPIANHVYQKHKRQNEIAILFAGDERGESEIDCESKREKNIDARGFAPEHTPDADTDDRRADDADRIEQVAENLRECCCDVAGVAQIIAGFTARQRN